jgi:glycerol uptake facilitator-like aquaporin
MDVKPARMDWSCFLETNPASPLIRRAAAEAVGTFFLAAAVFGSVFLVQTVSQPSIVAATYVPSVAAAGALVALIFALGGSSGGHFNPLISWLQWLQGDRTAVCALGYTIAQFAGGLAGTAAIFILRHAPSPAAVAPAFGQFEALSEFLATAGLMLVIFCCMRSGRGELAPLAVGAWFIAMGGAAPEAAYVNPVILVATLCFVAHGDGTAVAGAAYLGVEIAGALSGYAIAALVYPRHAPVGASEVNPPGKLGQAGALEGTGTLRKVKRS